MGDAEAPPLLAAQALLLEARGRDLIVFNPGALRCTRRAPQPRARRRPA